MVSATSPTPTLTLRLSVAAGRAGLVIQARPRPSVVVVVTRRPAQTRLLIPARLRPQMKLASAVATLVVKACPAVGLAASVSRPRLRRPVMADARLVGLSTLAPIEVVLDGQTTTSAQEASQVANGPTAAARPLLLAGFWPILAEIERP